MDYQGGSGNGLAWYAASDAILTNSPLYQKYSQKQIAALDPNAVKADIGAALASAESAPILNYLHWVLTLSLAVA